MTIRSVTDADLPAIMAFWNPLIRDTAVTFSSEEKTVPSLQRMIAERQAAGRAFLVAEAAGRPVGLATYDRFRASNGYAHTMEHTIILSPDAQGRGLGRALMAAIEDHARRAGAHSMIAAVSAENRAGEAGLCPGRPPPGCRAQVRALDGPAAVAEDPVSLACPGAACQSRALKARRA